MNITQLDTFALDLRDGGHARVDEDIADRFARYTWKVNPKGYVCRSTWRGRVYLHRVVMSAGPGQIVDHINGDKLDNRRENLRFCTAAQNTTNAKRSWGTSRFKGVSWCARTRLWRAQISVNGTRIRLGGFPTEIEAASAYDQAALRHFGEFAAPNSSLFPTPTAGRPA